MITESPVAKYVTCRPIETDAAGDKAFDFARACLSECLSTHEDCKTQEPVLLPSRVMDIGTEQGCQRCKLHETDPHGEIGSYAALSYCWGGPQAFFASTTSLERLKSGFLLANLPQTIKDAVEVTRKLGLRYLWVDALCILQDCDADKAVQIERMGSIYKNATVTIAASISNSVTEGFLRTPRQEIRTTSPFQLQMDDGSTAEIHISLPWMPTLNNPLDKRGWAFQEGFLSPRLLRYTDLEFIWTCQKTPFKTISGGKMYKSFGLDQQRLPTRRSDYASPGANSRRAVRANPSKWKYLVTEYTSGKLTYSEDRIPALAGIVAELKNAWNDEYLHGLWKSCIIPLLAWISMSRDSRRSSRAPSWSWLSLNTEIRYYDIEKEDAISLPMDPGKPEMISLHCKMHKKNWLDKKITVFLSLDDGSLDDERKNEKLSYLLLGVNEKRTSRTISHIGILVTEVEPGLYRRVGFFVTPFAKCEVWENCERTNILLE